MTAMTFAKEEKDTGQRARNREIVRQLLSRAILFGETMIVHAVRKQTPHPRAPVTWSHGINFPISEPAAGARGDGPLTAKTCLNATAGPTDCARAKRNTREPKSRKKENELRETVTDNQHRGCNYLPRPHATRSQSRSQIFCLVPRSGIGRRTDLDTGPVCRQAAGEGQAGFAQPVKVTANSTPTRPSASRVIAHVSRHRISSASAPSDRETRSSRKVGA